MRGERKGLPSSSTMSTRVMGMGSTLTTERSEVNTDPKDSSPSSTSSLNSTRETEAVVVTPPPGGRVTSTGEVEKSTSSDWDSGDNGEGQVCTARAINQCYIKVHNKPNMFNSFCFSLHCGVTMGLHCSMMLCVCGGGCGGVWGGVCGGGGGFTSATSPW